MVIDDLKNLRDYEALHPLLGKAKLETHNEYIDVHVPITDGEVMGRFVQLLSHTRTMARVSR